MSSHTRRTFLLVGVIAVLLATVVVRLWSNWDSSRPIDAFTRPVIHVYPQASFPATPVMPEMSVVHRFDDPRRRDVRYGVDFIDKDAPEDICRINDRGDVLSDEALYHTGHWTTLVNSDKSSGLNQTETSALNNRGDVIGTISGSSDGAYLLLSSEAVTWQGGHMRVVLPPSTGGDTEGLGINERGQMLIQFDFQTASEEDFSCGILSGHKTRDLGPGTPCCLNDRGAVVIDRASASTRTDDAPYVGVEKGKVVGDRTAPYFVVDGNVKYAIDVPTKYGDTIDKVTAINDRDDVVGNLETQGVPKQTTFDYLPNIDEAFVWSGGRFTVLGSLGGDGSKIGGINDYGDVVGSADIVGKRDSNTGNEPTRAFLYKDGRLHDLNHFISAHSGWVLYRAWDINNRGQIVCSGNKGLCLLTLSQ